MSVVSDARVFVDILNVAGRWLRAARGRARAERDRPAAQVLHDAFVLVASMRCYDNAFRPLLGQLHGFSASWDHERREKLRKELEDFLDHEEYLPHFRQALSALSQVRGDIAGGHALDRLLDRASTFNNSVARKIMDQKENWIIRTLVLRHLQEGSSAGAEREVHAWATKMVGLLNRRLLADADSDFGELRQAILAAHDLPDPGSAITLPRGGSARS